MIVVGSTITNFAMNDPNLWGSWLRNAEQIKASHPEVQYFCAIEMDKRGVEPFQPLIDRLTEIGGEYWTYVLDDGRTEVTTKNRVRHICFGRNMIVEYAFTAQATHILYLDTDCSPPDDILPKLLETGHPLVASFIPTYCLTGPLDPAYPDYPMMDTWASAGSILAARSVYGRIRWRWEWEPEMTDDPCYYHDAKDLLGVHMRVRKDVITRHYPEHVVGFERRGHDARVER